jgi:hypothetical protein
VKGLGAKRNWITGHFGSVFMVDDDLKGITRLYSTYRRAQVSADEAYYLIQNVANIANMAGAYLFGFNHNRHVMHFPGHEPFRMSGYINGAAIGILAGSKLKFSTEIVGANDFYISALNAYHHRMCVMDQRFVPNQESVGKTAGGLGAHRNNDSELNDMKILNRLFGDAIVKKGDFKTGNKSLKYGRTLKVPY